MNLIYLIDQRGLEAINNFANSNKIIVTIFTSVAEYTVYAIPIFFILYWYFPIKQGKNHDRRIALQAVFSGLLSWLVFSNILGRIINRMRPFEPGGIQEILFHRPTYSFPSDHAAFFFALATTFFITKTKKISYTFLIVAVFVSIARIGVGIHWPTDIIGGALLGIGIAYLVDFFDKYFNKIYFFIIKIAQKLRLA